MSLTIAEKFGSFFYLVSPNKTSFEHYEDVPQYVTENYVVFLIAIVAEMVLRLAMGKEIRLHETLSSAIMGGLHDATLAFVTPVMFLGYDWLYQHRLFDLRWDSSFTWFGALFFVDFCYYWIHRANHEVNILWATHQIHHSIEDFDLSAAIRIGIFQRAAYVGFYLPLAVVGFPMSITAAHAAFNLIFQFWVHTELIDNVGPLEYIFMTPSHHRVHHGSNKWCLDKNYASIFIIWDKIFGTFEPERKGEKIVYGLTDQPQTINSLYFEFYYFGVIYKKFKSMSSWGDSMKAILYGPGWCPGTPRLGDPDTFPDIKAPRKKYDPQVAKWKIAYIILHMLVALFPQQYLITELQNLSSESVLLFLSFLFISAGIMGAVLDGRQWAGIVEAVRCAVIVAYCRARPVTNISNMNETIITLFSASMMLWTFHSINALSSHMKILKVE